jgi:predicted transcriptional regulator
MVTHKKVTIKKTSITIRLPKYLKEQIKVLAQAEDRSVTSYVTVAIKAKLDKDENS